MCVCVSMCVSIYDTSFIPLTSIISCFLIRCEPEGVFDVRPVSQDGFQDGFLLCGVRKKRHMVNFQSKPISLR